MIPGARASTRSRQGSRLAPALAWALALGLFGVASLSPRSAFADGGDKLVVTPQPRWVEAIAPDLGATAVVGSSNGREYLLLQSDVRVGQGGLDAYSHIAVRITSEAGLQSSSQLSLEFDATYQRLEVHYVVVRRDGLRLDRLNRSAVKIVQRQAGWEQGVYDGQRSALLFIEDVRVGDVIEYAYTLHGTDPTLDGQFVDAVALGAPEPIAHLHTRLALPPGHPLHVKVHGPRGSNDPALDPTIRSDASGAEYVWDRRGVPVYESVPDTPPGYTLYPWAQVTEFDSWRAVAAWGRKLFEVPQPSPKLVEQIKRWQREATSMEDLVLRAVRFVQDDVRYAGIEVGMGRRRPTDPGVVFERRYGDCKDKSTLLVSILRSVEIPAYPALVSSSLGKALPDWDPSPAAFDHVIVRVGPITGTEYWIDATASGQGGGLDRQRLSSLGWALVLEPGKGELDRIPAPTASDARYTAHERFTEPAPESSGEAGLEAERIYEGSAAEIMRASFKTRSPAQIGQTYLQGYAHGFPGIVERAPIDRTDDRERNRLVVLGHYSIPQLWKWDEGDKLFRLQANPSLIDYFLPRPTVLARTAPLEFLRPLHVHQDLHFTLPLDWTQALDDQRVDGAAFTFTLASTYANRQLTYSYDLVVREDEIAPEKLAEHLADVDKARAMLPRSLTFRPALPDGPNWYMIVPSMAFLPLLGWGARRAYLARPRLRVARALPDPHLTGFGSLLWLIALRLVSGPLVVIPSLRHSGWLYSRAGWSAFSRPHLPTHDLTLLILAVFELPVLVAMAAYSVVVAVVFFQKKRSFPFHFAVFTLAYLAFTVVDHAALGLSGRADASVGRVVGSQIVSLLLLLYVRSSRRVASRFVVG
jgi:transglutaminase-like putative cysteine protease